MPPTAPCLVLALIALAQVSAYTRPLLNSKLLQTRPKRSPQHIISDCMTVKSEPGHYFFKSTGEDSTVCGIYLTAEPDRVVEVLFDYLDVPCASGGLVAFVDGWELNGGFFPRVEDSPRSLEERVTEFCGSVPPRRLLVSSQNAALIQYRVPKRSRGFSFRVNFARNPTPCNILLMSHEDIFTLHNFGRAVNCSLTALFPVKLSVLSLSVGPSQANTGTMLKCKEEGASDYVEIGGGVDVGLAKIETSETVCGLDSIPGRVIETVVCEVSTIRMVSSGRHENSVTFSVHQATERDLNSATLICPI